MRSVGKALEAQERKKSSDSDGLFQITASWSLETFVNQLFRYSGSERVSNFQSHVISVNRLRRNSFETLRRWGASSVNHPWIVRVHWDRSPPSGETYHRLWFLPNLGSV